MRTMMKKLLIVTLIVAMPLQAEAGPIRWAGKHIAKAPCPVLVAGKALIKAAKALY